MFDDFFLSIHFDYHILEPYKKIYVLVSGGVDSTLLADFLYSKYPDRVYFVNCYNPFEGSATLDYFKGKPNFIQIKPDEKIDYGKVLRDAFLKIPAAIQLRKQGKYEKKFFNCCKIIKHDAFKKDPLFIEAGCCVVSGIKAGDGKMRRFFLKDLRNGTIPQSNIRESSFFHKHKWGATYCYPFRDYYSREFPKDVMDELMIKYPKLHHSGCVVCPVLIVFNLTKSPDYNRSLRYYNRLVTQKLF